ncbi:Phosphoglycerol transferase MdoB [Pedobacter westerhofensis]|uniref:Phosphoglycerol transferase MdoB n=1 Tax=Pedobacter westerhofensis TaxID=425512 RepID=A0A521BKV6_9SPHI|nr:alkaline phosphatase family protein [Pedobacter westerhofensis]SMO47729.1 Phosphoglycerol transferase MdoB [Pedobacter westerhofensis]
MLKALIFFARFFIFWLVFFLLDRVIFVCNFLKDIHGGTFTEIIAVAWHGIRLDLAAAAYIISIPLLWFVISYLIAGREKEMAWLRPLNKVFIVLFSAIAVINLNIYREWGSKVNAKAIGFAFSSPNEALASSASSPIFFSLGVLAALIASGFVLNRLILEKEIWLTKAPVWAKIPFAVLLIGLNFLLIRGGWGVSPNNQSMAYYSDQQVLNHAAVNTEWNLIADLLKSRHSERNPYNYGPEKSAEQLIKDLYSVKKDTTVHVLKNSRPNVVVIIMESFTADLTKTLGNEDGITPKFDSLVRQGLLFSRIYATGNRTDKGIIGTLAGYPSLAAESIVKFPEKMERISALSRELRKNGYQTSFFYGGQSEFDNYKAFVLSHGYDLLIDKSKFNSRDMNSKWGAYDGTVFNAQLEHLNQAKQPFFSTQMTLTNHEPFEVPGTYKFGNSDNVHKFKSTAFYTDSCLYDFLTKARKEPWYANTLFVFVADHGHIMPKGRDQVYIPQRYHIPLLFFGDVIKEEFRGKTMGNVGSQIDIPSTLLHQLDIGSSTFVWSKNLLNPVTKSFAYFSWDNGMGFIDNKQCVTFDNVGKTVLYNDRPQDARNTKLMLKNAQSYMQSAYHHFLAL